MFKIIGTGDDDFTDKQATDAYNKAVTYLTNSDMAKFVINELDGLDEEIVICVGTKLTDNIKKKFAFPQVYTKRGLQDAYFHPNTDGKTLGQNIEGGVIMWDPTYDLPVTDKAKYRKHYDWVTQHTETVSKTATIFGKTFNIPGTKEVDIDVVGTISAPVCLAHEMGHTMQCFTDYDAYKKLNTTNTEDLNVEAIEHTVINELNEKGKTETIRWDYFHTV